MTTQLMQAPRQPSDIPKTFEQHQSDEMYSKLEHDALLASLDYSECEDLDFMQELIDEPVAQYAPLTPFQTVYDVHNGHVNEYNDHVFNMLFDDEYAGKYGLLTAHVRAYRFNEAVNDFDDGIPF